MVLCSTLRVRKEGADGEKLHVRARYYSDRIVSIIMLLVGIGIGITAWLGSSQLNWDFMLCGFLFLLALINVLSGLRGLIYDVRFEDLIVDKANGTMTRATFGMFGQARQESDVPLSEITQCAAEFVPRRLKQDAWARRSAAKGGHVEVRAVVKLGQSEPQPLLAGPDTVNAECSASYCGCIGPLSRSLCTDFATGEAELAGALNEFLELTRDRATRPPNEVVRGMVETAMV